MKKGLIFLIISIMFFSICIFFIEPKNIVDENSNKIKVEATLFPQYDFAKQIGGDKVEVSLLLTPGTETHTYEPTPQDIIRINKSDIFIYTGKYMEPWADRIIQSITSDTKVLDASKNINLIKADNDDEDEEEIGHNHEYDPHIWLDPRNAIVMINNIKEQLIQIDASNKEYYEKNAQKIIDEITELDLEIEDVINRAELKEVAFGGTFAYAYFMKRYNLQYVSAYDSCGEDTEPSVANVKKVIDVMKNKGIKVIFYQELSSGKIADSIAKETGAQKLVFHTVHNASQDEINRGETYISIMRRNLENLKIALSK